MPQPQQTDDRQVKAEARELRRRKKEIANIRAFADWLEDHPEAPAPQTSSMQHSLHGPWDEQIAVAERVAKALGVEVKRRDTSDGRPTVSVEVAVGDVRYVVFGSNDEPIEQMKSSVDPDAFAEASARQAEQEAAVEPEPAHRMASGWKGEEPGECGASCSCGLTYDGFDSLNAASELVEKHAAEANAKPYRCDKPGCTGEPHDGHVYACCGKVGRISAHELWCETRDTPSIEDAPPRGSDAAEEHTPKPDTVEGHGHQRNGDWHDEPPAAATDLTFTSPTERDGAVRRWRLSGPAGTVLFEVVEAAGVLSPSVYLLPPGGSEHEREALIGGRARYLHRRYAAEVEPAIGEQVIRAQLQAWYGEFLASGHMRELWELSDRVVDAEAERASCAALADERERGGA